MRSICSGRHKLRTKLWYSALSAFSIIIPAYIELSPRCAIMRTLLNDVPWILWSYLAVTTLLYTYIVLLYPEDQRLFEGLYDFT
jgi:hypothetical protein